MGQFFTAPDGAEINYVDIGQGPVLLYVHAFGENVAIKAPFFEPLAKHFRVLSFDQRGWGETKAQGELSLDQSAKDAKALIEFLGLEDVYYVGYSMGAADLFAYVRQFGTQHLRRVAIIDMTPCLINKEGWSCGLYQGHYTEAQYKRDLETMDRDFKDFNIYFFTEALLPNSAANKRDFAPTREKYESLLVMLKDMPGGAEAMLTLPEDVQKIQKAYWVSMCENDFREVLPAIDKPMGIICARPGSLYNEETAAYIASKVQKPRLYPIDKATHMVGTTHAAEVLEKLIEFGKEQ